MRDKFPETIQECRSQLLERLQAATCTGDFTLTSGRKSAYYVDGKQVTLDATGLYCCARLILELLEPDIVAVGGPTIGADPIVGAVLSLAGQVGRPLSGFLARKQPKSHGTRKLIEGSMPSSGPVVLVEDVATTGGSLLRCITAVRSESECEVAAAIVLLDRQEGAARALEAEGCRLVSLFTAEDLGVPR